MKHLYKFIIPAFIIIVVSCSKKENPHMHNESAIVTDDPNKALSDQLDGVHMDLMPKMETIFNLKNSLKEKLSTKDITADRKKLIEDLIIQLDSADHSMGDWMHQYFKPSDTTNQETVRAYLESEMIKINKLKDLMNETIEKANEELKKK